MLRPLQAFEASDSRPEKQRLQNALSVGVRWYLSSFGIGPGFSIESSVVRVQNVLGHDFADQALLVQALTHSSFSNERGNPEQPVSLLNNERLEFLGDAVIGLVVARQLMFRFPGATEGDLSRWRSSLVSRHTLSAIASELQLGTLLLLGKGERRTGGSEKSSILAAAFEAVVGALYLDGGMDRAEGFLERVFSPWLESLEKDEANSVRRIDKKTYLQEKSQGRFKSTPVYRVVDSWGLEHEKFFRVEILIEGKSIAMGEGRSKKQAEQSAASLALEILEF